MKSPVPKIAWLIIALPLAAKLLLHLAAIGEYGYFRDELYYLASTEHLGFGYVDHPPLSIWILAAQRALFGDSLPALRILPVLAGLGVALLTALMAREIGGGRFAQGLAALAAVVSPMYLGMHHVYSMNAFDHLLWALAAYVLVRSLVRETPRLWILLGVILGLGLMNKISVLWLGAGLAVGLLITSNRRLLITRWPWLAGAIAGAMFLPYVIWQVRNGWPTLEFMRNATELKMVPVSVTEFAVNQLVSMNPATALVWMAGLAYCLLPAGNRPWRILGFIWLVVAAILASSGTSRASYLAPAYPMLFAPGALAWERVFSGRILRWVRPVPVAAMVLFGAALAPFGVPILPPDTFVEYMEQTGTIPAAEERTERAELPQHYADMFGWDEMTEKVARVYERLPQEERAVCSVFAQNYGEAGAIDVLGRRLGLPPALCGHNSYGLWGPGDATGKVLIIIGGDPEDHAEVYASVEQVDTIDCPRCMPYERDLPLFLCREPKTALEEIWPRIRFYI